MEKLERSENGSVSVLVRPRELSKREKEVVQLVAMGYKNKEVAEKLGVATKTVETHRANIMNKLALRNIAQLIRYAIQKGLVTIETD
jgi:two-component system response regulator NreC